MRMVTGSTLSQELELLRLPRISDRNGRLNNIWTECFAAPEDTVVLALTACACGYVLVLLHMPEPRYTRRMIGGAH